MLYYDWIDVSKGINIKCFISHHNYFCGRNLNFLPCVCSGCDNTLQIPIGFNYVVTVTVKTEQQTSFSQRRRSYI